MSLDVFRRYGNLLRPDGTNQLQRLLPALESDYVVPDERDFSALIEYARKVAAEVRYYDLSGQATGDWQAMFESLLIPGTGAVRSSEDLEAMLASRSDWPPHLVLFLVFLKLFQLLQDDLNQLTQRHLLHYYEKELGLARRPAVSDAVHVVFELAKNAAATLLPAGTRLDAGKDDEGRPLIYTMQNDLVVSQATLADMRRLVVETDPSHNTRLFTAGGFMEVEAPGGYTFGRRQLDLEPAARFMTEAALGFIVSSPVLRMAEGERTIRLRAHLQPDAGLGAVVTQGLTGGLDVAVTGAGGWLTANSFEATLLANGGLGMPALLLTLTVGADAPAIVAADPALHGAGLAGARPALRCLAKGEAGLYELFARFVVQRVDIDVDVKGIRTLVVQNDESLLESGKPLAPFGSQPRIGSAFYVGSSEIFGKRVTQIDAHLEWKSPPEDLLGHYAEYFDFTDSGLTDAFYSKFQVDLDLLYEREFHNLTTGMPLFEPVPARPHTITATESLFDTALRGIEFEEHPDLAEPVVGFDGTSRYGFLRFRLSAPTRTSMLGYAVQAPFEAFGHSSFAMRYAVQAIALSASPPPNPKPQFPKEPYTPVLSSLSLDYRATASLLPAQELAEAQFYVVHPFGVRRARATTEARMAPPYESSAALFLGIGNLSAPANVSLYFDIDVGTATGSQLLLAGDTQWSYLDTEDIWRPLDAAAVLIDGTEGFQRPGVIEISVPKEASVTPTSMPAGLLWLRARITKAPENAARTLSIRPQAVLAGFTPGALPIETYTAHLEAGLPAGTIAKLVTRNAAIARLQQPNASFGGHGAENTPEFIRRGSERLRHRNRAITPWDYERLVLEQFPDVFKVRCLPHTDQTVASRAGHTALVIVPNLRRTSGAANPLEPRAGDVLLGEVAEYLDELATPFAQLHVIRPAFERLRVEAKVVFMRGRDPGYFARVLNEDLRRFLSPWAYREGEDILFGARIYRSDILAFIEGREYVDHVINLRVYHSFDGEKPESVGGVKPAIDGMTIGDDFIVGSPVEVAETTQPHAILVSHPEHLITPVAAGAEICSGTTRLGIGYMTIGLDFDVGLEAPA
ncbi:MAG: hypothetical protein U1E83_05970 [Methylotetracoccus sp.]